MCARADNQTITLNTTQQTHNSHIFIALALTHTNTHTHTRLHTHTHTHSIIYTLTQTHIYDTIIDEHGIYCNLCWCLSLITTLTAV